MKWAHLEWDFHATAVHRPSAADSLRQMGGGHWSRSFVKMNHRSITSEKERSMDRKRISRVTESAWCIAETLITLIWIFSSFSRFFSSLPHCWTKASSESFSLLCIYSVAYTVHALLAVDLFKRERIEWFRWIEEPTNKARSGWWWMANRHQFIIPHPWDDVLWRAEMQQSYLFPRVSNCTLSPFLSSVCHYCIASKQQN